MAKKILFIDRDGTIVLEPNDYQMDSLDKLEFYPNVFQYLGKIAKEMDFELRGVKIDVSGILNPARLFGQSFEERAGFKEISVMIKADTDADEATLEKWMQAIEDRCPVSDNLQHPTPVKIAVKATTINHTENLVDVDADIIVNPFSIISSEINIALTAPNIFKLEKWLYKIDTLSAPLRIFPKGLYIICGYGRMGQKIFEKLDKNNIESKLDISKKLSDPKLVNLAKFVVKYKKIKQKQSLFVFFGMFPT